MTQDNQLQVEATKHGTVIDQVRLQCQYCEKAFEYQVVERIIHSQGGWLGICPDYAHCFIFI